MDRPLRLRISAALKALPASDVGEMDRYARQQLAARDQARVYANNFIDVNLQEVAGGRTWSQVSVAAQANPQDAKLAAQVQTLFRGETLRGLLLNAWAGRRFAMYALYAAIALTLAAIAVLCVLSFEVVMSRRAAVQLIIGSRSSAATAIQPSLKCLLTGRPGHKPGS